MNIFLLSSTISTDLEIFGGIRALDRTQNTSVQRLPWPAGSYVNLYFYNKALTFDAF